MEKFSIVERYVQASAAAEQADAEEFLQLPHPRRHVGRHAMQLLRRAHDPAFLDDGPEDGQGFEVDRSHGENVNSHLFISQQSSDEV